jgi:hypothetical protein
MDFQFSNYFPWNIYLPSIPTNFKFDIPSMPTNINFNIPNKLPFDLPQNFPIDDKLIIISLISIIALASIVSILLQVWSIIKTLVLLIVLIVSLVIPIIVFLYVVNLEDPSCDCIKDWRINFIKYWTVISFIIGLIITLTGNVYLALLLSLINIVNVYALFTYISDLNNQNCKCITGTLALLNNFLYYWRYFMVISVCFSLLVCIWRFSVIAESKKHPHFIMIPSKK